MKLAGRQLRDTDIRAPFAGYVERRLVNLGELVKVQMPVMGIVRLDPAEGDGRAAREDGPGSTTAVRSTCASTPTVIARSPARSHASARPSTPPRAHFHSRRSSRIPTLRSSPVQFARVHVESGKVDDVLTLPYSALQYRYGVNRVFVVKGDRLSMRELQIGERLGDRVEIASGVVEGEPVAVTDVDTLSDGARVTVTR